MIMRSMICLDLSDMKGMANVLGVFMKPRAHGHVLCAALQLSLSDRAVDLEKGKRKPVPREILAISV